MGIIYSYIFPKTSKSIGVDEVLNTWDINREYEERTISRLRKKTILEFMRDPRTISEPIDVPEKKESFR